MHSTFKQGLSKSFIAALFTLTFLVSGLAAKSLGKSAEIESNRLSNFNLDSVLSKASLVEYLEPQTSVRPPTYGERAPLPYQL